MKIGLRFDFDCIDAKTLTTALEAVGAALVVVECPDVRPSKHLLDNYR